MAVPVSDAVTRATPEPNASDQARPSEVVGEKEDQFSPPYLSFGTFRNFIVSLGEKSVPPRIDRSMMVGMAGGTQTALLQALNSFKLIGSGNEVTPDLYHMATDEKFREKKLKQLLERHYPEQLDLAAKQATAAQLSESFAPYGISGSTLRKAVTFFLNMARNADVPMSPHFRAPSQKRYPGSVRTKRTSASRGRADTKAPTPDAETAPVGATAAESHTIELRSGGTVTLSCTTSFLALSRDDRNFLFKLVDELRDYETSIDSNTQSRGSTVQTEG